jgi:hypothetical protein
MRVPDSNSVPERSRPLSAINLKPNPVEDGSVIRIIVLKEAPKEIQYVPRDGPLTIQDSPTSDVVNLADAWLVVRQ